MINNIVLGQPPSYRLATTLGDLFNEHFILELDEETVSSLLDSVDALQEIYPGGHGIDDSKHPTCLRLVGRRGVVCGSSEPAPRAWMDSLLQKVHRGPLAARSCPRPG